MATKAFTLLAVLALLLVHAVGAQGAVCTAPQVANYSGAKLVGLVGSIGWVSDYYNFTGSTSAQIVDTQVIQGSYLVYANYIFSGPDNLGTPAGLVFVLGNNTAEGCANMTLFAYQEIVAPYSPAALISAENATAIAQNEGYNVTFGQPITLVPASMQAGIEALVPGYQNSSLNYTVYANAQNGSVYSTANAKVASGQAAASSSQPGASSWLSDIYRLFVGIADWVKGLFSASG